LDNYKFSFTPVNKPGAMSPLYKGIKCKGYDLRDYTNKEVISRKQLYLWQMQALYKDYPDKANFFNSYFNSLAGTGTLKEQLLAGKTEDEIRASWQEGLNKFKAIRKKYLLYPDFDH
ncbi:MAG TPA: DUF1343 domain-containing protein, partial [Bacteroidia bacterium]|nr:DUF1343 domain-containing protein [Bacteroidia bacterium]